MACITLERPAGKPHFGHEMLSPGSNAIGFQTKIEGLVHQFNSSAASSNCSPLRFRCSLISAAASGAHVGAIQRPCSLGCFERSFNMTSLTYAVTSPILSRGCRGGRPSVSKSSLEEVPFSSKVKIDLFRLLCSHPGGVGGALEVVSVSLHSASKLSCNFAVPCTFVGLFWPACAR